MRRLVLLRHGRTEWNRLGMIQGQLDVPLDDVGVAQAAAVAPYVAGFTPVALWTSDLARAAETAARVGLAAGLMARLDQRLRERSFGELEGLSHAELERRAPRDYAAFRSGDFDLLTTAEPSDLVTARLRAAADELLGLLEAGETAVVVSHGAALKLLTGLLIGLPPEASVASLVGMENCAWAEVTFAPGAGVGSGRLLAYNRTAISQ